LLDTKKTFGSGFSFGSYCAQEINVPISITCIQTVMLLVMLVTKQLLNIKPLQTDQRAPHTAGTGAAPITTTGTIRRGRAHLTSQMRLRLGELQRAAAAVVADAAGAGAAARLLRRGEQVGGGGGGRVGRELLAAAGRAEWRVRVGGGGGWLGVAALGVLARLLGGGAWPLGVVFAQVGQLF